MNKVIGNSEVGESWHFSCYPSDGGQVPAVIHGLRAEQESAVEKPYRLVFSRAQGLVKKLFNIMYLKEIKVPGTASALNPLTEVEVSFTRRLPGDKGTDRKVAIVDTRSPGKFVITE